MKKNEQIKKEIIDKVVEYIDKKQYLPWDKGLLNDFIPINPLTGTVYKGINKRLLTFLGGDTQEYATFNQIKEKGGKIKKGSKGLPITYYDWRKWNKTEKRPWVDGDNEKDLQKIPFLKKYTVFSFEDIEGLEKTRELNEKPYNPRYGEADEAITDFIEATKLQVTFRNGTGCYIPLRHAIEITPLKGYKTSEMYYKTFFHELTHSTGKALDRENESSFGSHKYSVEEIIAEFGAAMLCELYGIKIPFENTAEYLRGWSQNLLKNPNWLFDGVKEAEKAVEYFVKTVEEYRQNNKKVA